MVTSTPEKGLLHFKALVDNQRQRTAVMTGMVFVILEWIEDSSGAQITVEEDLLIVSFAGEE